MQARNARYGLQLFAVYFVFYAGFVLLNAFSPATMRLTPIAGINLAILYGFGLILAAFVLAIFYGFLCRIESVTNEPSSSDSSEKDSVQG